jgi:hypothetical protein
VHAGAVDPVSDGATHRKKAGYISVAGLNHTHLRGNTQKTASE